jgi:hypothetical protein
LIAGWTVSIINSRPMTLQWPVGSQLSPAPNQRLKLSARGGRLVGNGSVLSAAAAGRSLSAIR